MRVFISSVRRGLEAERDSLPGLLKAIGHEPVRFEDFTAQADPSRQACLEGIDNSDVYLLLLGPTYGFRFPDTGQSPTHDEYRRARTRGLPKLVFRRLGETPEPDQQALIDEIGDYSTGSFYGTYSDTSELLTKVAAALRELEQQPSALTFEALSEVPPVSWLTDWDDPRRGPIQHEQVVELHAVPIESVRVSNRLLRGLSGRLGAALRASELIDLSDGLHPDISDTAATITTDPDRRTAFDEVRPRRLLGIRADAGGQLSVWWRLPGDGMGGMLNRAELEEALTVHLRLIGAMGVDRTRRYAVAIGANGSMTSIVDGALPAQSRTQTRMLSVGRDSLRVLPDESVNDAAFYEGAHEVAVDLASKLIATFTCR